MKNKKILRKMNFIFHFQTAYEGEKKEKFIKLIILK